MSDSWESYLRAYAEHRATRADARASHEKAPSDAERDRDQDARATGPDRAQAERGMDLDPESDRRGW